MTQLKYQNYNHYKLPITINPIEYGKLIFQIDNIFIIQINKTNIVLITQIENINHIKLFKEGELMFEFKDVKTTDNIFIRSLFNKRFTFENNKLVSTEKLIIRFFLNLIPLFVRNINSTTLLNYNTNLT